MISLADHVGMEKEAWRKLELYIENARVEYRDDFGLGNSSSRSRAARMALMITGHQLHYRCPCGASLMPKLAPRLVLQACSNDDGMTSSARFQLEVMPVHLQGFATVGILQKADLSGKIRASSSVRSLFLL